jgi:hypothetical protein
MIEHTTPVANPKTIGQKYSTFSTPIGKSAASVAHTSGQA